MSLSAYAEAVVYLQTPSGTVRVQRAPVSWTTGDFPGPQGQVIHVITAHNPAGIPCDRRPTRPRRQAWKPS